MSTAEIVISKKLIYRIAVILGIVVVLLLVAGKFPGVGRAQNTAIGGDLVAGSQEKFDFLSGQGQQQRSVGST